MASDEWVITTNNGPLGFLSHQSPGEEEVEEPDQRELDLWLLESQVPGCTRERAVRAYEQGQEDVARALPLARMATLLGDRAYMVAFLMEQLPGSTQWEATSCYDAEGEDVVEAVIALHRRTQQRLNQPILSSRAKQRLRIRTVFMLALLYRERYGQLEREAEEALARAPIDGRLRSGARSSSFRTPDGSVWTHTRQEGWERRAPLTPASLGRAVRATEQLADAAEARGQAQTAHRARQTAADLQEQLDNNPTNPPSPQSPLPPPVLRRSDERARLVHTPDGLERYTTVMMHGPHYDTHLLARGRGPAFTRDYGPEDLERWHDWDPSVDASDADDNGGDDHGDEDDQQPPMLAAESSSSSAEEDDDEENERPTAGTYARPRRFVRSAVRVHPREAMSCLVKNQLRTIQEQLDTEMANAAQGVVMSEGAYLVMMTAIKVLWEQVDPQPAEVN